MQTQTSTVVLVEILQTVHPNFTGGSVAFMTEREDGHYNLEDIAQTRLVSFTSSVLMYVKKLH